MKQVLFIDMEYSHIEINESIAFDTLKQSLDNSLLKDISITVWYRKFDVIVGMDYIDLSLFDIILISTKISSFFEMDEIINKLENQILIIGGVIASYAPELLAEKYSNAIICVGEGETNINSILRCAILANSSSQLKRELINLNIPNIYFYNEINDEITCTVRKAADLKIITQKIIHHNLNYTKKRDGLVRMETSRGCPWNQCRFCVMPWRYANTKWRPFPLERIKQELLYLSKCGVKRIYFTDEDFIGNRERLLDLCNMICFLKSNSLIDREMTFAGSTSVYTLLNLGKSIDTYLDNLYYAGIRLLFIGIESGSDSQLSRYKKGVTVENNLQILNLLKAHKIQTDIGFIMFDAETSLTELEENLDFLETAGLEQHISRFTKKLRVCPHTIFFDEYTKKGYLVGDFDINELDQNYIFKDPNINKIYQLLSILEKKLEKRENDLQSIIRMTYDKSKKVFLSKELIYLRNIEIEFLRNCVVSIQENLCSLEECLDKIILKYSHVLGEITNE